MDNYYVSNNKRLFRIVEVAGDLAMLENCATEEMQWLQFDVIAQMKQVIPSE